MALNTLLTPRLISSPHKNIVFTSTDTAYVCILAIWTIFLLTGIVLLHKHQHTYLIRMRNVRLSIVAVAAIHMYLGLVWLVHLLRPRFPCAAEFWIMSIYLPAGVALWQAQNMQLLHVSVQQRQHCSLPGIRQTFVYPRRLGEVKSWWRGLPWLWKTYVMIGMGMAVQFLMTLIIFLGSRRFKPWGSFGTFVDAQECRKGWEWMPSIFWQALWAYGFGPFILLQIRNIYDSHHWRMQTILSVVFSMPGTPLWVAALYAPAFATINKTWMPPLWFAPGIMVMQFVSIWCPLIELYRERRSVPPSPGAVVAQWESQRSLVKSKFDWRSSRAPSTIASSMRSNDSTLRKTNPDLYTMQALERALARDAAPLLNYAATKQFTGENIIFLVQVRDWRAEWKSRCRTTAQKKPMTDKDRRRLFASAVQIYAQSISMKTSPFPVNIESRIYAQLEALFGNHVAPLTRMSSASSLASFESSGTMYQAQADVTPFADNAFLLQAEEKSATAIMVAFEKPSRDGKTGEKSRSAAASEASTSVEELDELEPCGGDEYHGDGTAPRSRHAVPVDFDLTVFDQAEKSVLYMVLTNTWSRFVDSQAETLSQLSSTTGTNHSQQHGRTIQAILRSK